MQVLWRHQFRRTTLQLWCLLGMLIGIGLAHRWSLPASYWWILALLVSIVTFKKRRLLTLICVSVLGLGLGWWRGAQYLQALAGYDMLYYGATTLRIVANEDATYGKTKQLEFAAGGVQTAHGSLRGKLQISGFGVNAVYQGDELLVEGKLYPGYGSYQGSVRFAKLELISHHASVISDIRRRFVAGTQTALPEPLGPFAMGLLVGQRATLPADTKQDLQMVGLTHIIAVSGYNLTIILHASKRLFGKRSKRIATFLSLALIGVFLLLAGASASIVRAAIVSMLSIAATYYGRTFKPLNLIVLAAVITAWANPVYVWSDLSWYLSFLAFFGVMVLSPLIQARWPAKWQQSLLGGVALESISAELMTLPFVVHIFGQMSRVGLIANVLVVSLVPLAMLLGLIAGLAGMLTAAWAGWLAWPAVLLLTYMLDSAHILAHLPHVFAQNIGLSLLQMLGLYSLLGLVIASFWQKTRSRAKPGLADRAPP